MSDPHDLAAAYALDALDADERATFAAHLETCADCRRDVAEFEAAGAHLAGAAATPPPPDLKSSVMAAISGVAQVPADGDDDTGVTEGAGEPAVPPVDEAPAEAPDEVTPPAVVRLDDRRRTRRWLGAAAAIIVAVVAIGVVLNTGRNAVTVDDVFAAADVEITTLAGDETTLRVAWSRELDRVVVDGDALASPGAGNVYELWAIVDDQPVPAGLIDHAGGELETLIDVDDLDVAAWGITIEPAGGSETPTLPILYFAEV